MLGYKGVMENTKISTGQFTQEPELETRATGLKISTGHWTMTNSDWAYSYILDTIVHFKKLQKTFFMN